MLRCLSSLNMVLVLLTPGYSIMPHHMTHTGPLEDEETLVNFGIWQLQRRMLHALNEQQYPTRCGGGMLYDGYQDNEEQLTLAPKETRIITFLSKAEGPEHPKSLSFTLGPNLMTCWNHIKQVILVVRFRSVMNKPRNIRKNHRAMVFSNKIWVLPPEDIRKKFRKYKPQYENSCHELTDTNNLLNRSDQMIDENEGTHESNTSDANPPQIQVVVYTLNSKGTHKKQKIAIQDLDVVKDMRVFLALPTSVLKPQPPKNSSTLRLYISCRSCVGRAKMESVFTCRHWRKSKTTSKCNHLNPKRPYLLVKFKTNIN